MEAFGYTCTKTDFAEHATFGKELTLQYMVRKNIISKEIGDELRKTLFITCQDKSWFSRLFKGCKDEGVVFRLARLTKIPS